MSQTDVDRIAKLLLMIGPREEASSEDWTDSLRATFPIARTTSFSCFGGWKSIVVRLLERLSLVIQELPSDERGAFKVVEIRQKFGTLTVYLSGGPTPAKFCRQFLRNLITLLNDLLSHKRTFFMSSTISTVVPFHEFSNSIRFVASFLKLTLFNSCFSISINEPREFVHLVSSSSGLLAGFCLANEAKLAEAHLLQFLDVVN